MKNILHQFSKIRRQGFILFHTHECLRLLAKIVIYIRTINGEKNNNFKMSPLESWVWALGLKEYGPKLQ